MRPANIRKNGDFIRNIGPIGLFSLKHWILTQIKNSTFLMRTTRPCFQSQAALETLWDWDPCSIAISTTSSKTSITTFSIKPQRRWKPQLQPQQEKPTHNVNVTQVFFKSFYASDKYNKIFVLEKLGNALWTLVQHWNLINQNDTFTTSNKENKTDSVCGVCVCVWVGVYVRERELALIALITFVIILDDK